MKDTALLNLGAPQLATGQKHDVLTKCCFKKHYLKRPSKIKMIKTPVKAVCGMMKTPVKPVCGTKSTPFAELVLLAFLIG